MSKYSFGIGPSGINASVETQQSQLILVIKRKSKVERKLEKYLNSFYSCEKCKDLGLINYHDRRLQELKVLKEKVSKDFKVKFYEGTIAVHKLQAGDYTSAMNQIKTVEQDVNNFLENESTNYMCKRHKKLWKKYHLLYSQYLNLCSIKLEIKST